MISYLQLNHEIAFFTHRKTNRTRLSDIACGFITVQPDYNPARNAFGDKIPLKSLQRIVPHPSDNSVCLKRIGKKVEGKQPP